MKYSIVVVLGFLCVPITASAQASGGILSLIDGLIGFINTFVLPTLLAFAFAFFALNAIRYFIAESDDVSSRQNARDLAFYGITAFVIILIFWGLVRILVDGIGLGSSGVTEPRSDYFADRGANTSTFPPDNDAIWGQTPLSGPTMGIETENLGTIDTDALTEAALNDPILSNPPGGVDAIAAAAAAETVNTSRTSIHQTAETELENTITNLTNPTLSAAVANDPRLFADLLQSQPDNSFNDLDRLRAAYRLNQLGVIDTEQWNTYYNAVNAQRELAFAGDGGTISMADVQNIDVLPSTAVRSNLAVIQTELITTLDAHTNLSQDGIREVVESVYDPSLSAAERYWRVEELYYGQNRILNPNNQDTLPLLQSFEEQTNAELIYEGGFDSMIR